MTDSYSAAMDAWLEVLFGNLFHLIRCEEDELIFLKFVTNRNLLLLR